MKPRSFLTVGETWMKFKLIEYGGPEGLVYYGLRLASLTPEQRTEYFRLKKEELRLCSKMTNLKTENILEIDSDPPIPPDLEVQYFKVRSRIKELEIIMDEKVDVTKKEFLKRLYL